MKILEQEITKNISLPDSNIEILKKYFANCFNKQGDLDFEKFNANKIISISTVPEWNNKAVEKGVKKVCWKGHDNIEDWGERIAEMIENMLT